MLTHISMCMLYYLQCDYITIGCYMLKYYEVNMISRELPESPVYKYC